MNHGRRVHTSSVLRNGKVLVTGGIQNSMILNVVLNSTELYSPFQTN
jgi:hypothetical protein